MKSLRTLAVTTAIAVLSLTELVVPGAAMPLAQPGAKPIIDTTGIASNTEQIVYRRRLRHGGHWSGRHYRHWGGRHYGYNRNWYGRRYGWNRWNNSWCRYGRCGYHHYGYNYGNYGWYNPWPWFAAGAVLGVAGSYYNNDYYGGSNAHVRWCLNRYRSYDPRSDTYVGYDGYRHRCRARY